MIGHRADGRRVDLGYVDDRADVWLVRDYPPPVPLIRCDGEPTTMSELTCREVALHRTWIMYPDDWQGPLESDWELCDRSWRDARARYLEELWHVRPRLSRNEAMRRVSLRFPDDDEVARLEIVRWLIAGLQVLAGGARDTERRQPWIGARPHGRVETCYVERAHPTETRRGDVRGPHHSANLGAPRST